MLRRLKQWKRARRADSIYFKAANLLAEKMKCPTCNTRHFQENGHNSWGFIGYTCRNGHRFGVDCW